MEAAHVPLVIPGFELQVGPIMILFFFALILFGIFCTQCYYYYTTYEEDTLTLRFFVLTIWILESIHTSFCMHILYSYFVTNYGDPVNGVGHIVWSAGGTILIEMVILVMSEGFYINRISRLSGSWKVAAIPSVLLAGRVVLSLIAAAYLYIYPTWASFRKHSIPETCLTVSLSLAVATDFSVTVLLVYYLRKRRTAFSRTNNIITTLMKHTVHNGALAMIVSALVVITMYVVPTSLMFAGFVEIISKLYANSMVASLNARQRVAQIGTTQSNTIEMLRQDTQVHVSRNKVSFHDPVNNHYVADNKRASMHIRVGVDTTVESYAV